MMAYVVSIINMIFQFGAAAYFANQYGFNGETTEKPIAVLPTVILVGIMILLSELFKKVSNQVAKGDRKLVKRIAKINEASITLAVAAILAIIIFTVF